MSDILIETDRHGNEPKKHADLSLAYLAPVSNTNRTAALVPRDLPPLHPDLEEYWRSQIEEVCRANLPSEITDGNCD